MAFLPRRSIAFVATALGLGLLGAGSTSHAQGNPSRFATALVVPEPLAEEARAFAEGRSDVRVIVVPEADETSAEDLARARRLVDEAWEGYVALEFEPSLAAIREAVVLLESHARTDVDFDLLADALVLRGMNELALEREAQARESFLSALRMRPERTLSESRYPPRVRALYEEQRRELQAEPAASVTVTSSPAGAGLFLDGEPAGTAPTTVYGRSGRHQLRLELPGYASRTLTSTLETDGGPPLQVELFRADAEEAAAQVGSLEGDTTLTDASVRALASTLGARQALWMVPEGEMRTVVRVSLVDGSVERAEADSIATAMVAFPAPAEPRAVDDTPRDGRRRNEGLLFRVAAGLAGRGDQLTRDEPALEAEGSGLGLELAVSVGGSLAPGVVVGGHLHLWFLPVRLPVGEDRPLREAPEATVQGVAMVAAFLDWYPSAEGGWHLLLAAGPARTELEGGETGIEDRSLIGGGLSAGAGYEWWIADEWGAGVFVRLAGYRLEADDVSHNIGGLSVSGTLSFN